jgi:hypothetical protein
MRSTAALFAVGVFGCTVDPEAGPEPTPALTSHQPLVSGPTCPAPEEPALSAVAGTLRVPWHGDPARRVLMQWNVDNSVPSVLAMAASLCELNSARAGRGEAPLELVLVSVPPAEAASIRGTVLERCPGLPLRTVSYSTTEFIQDWFEFVRVGTGADARTALLPLTQDDMGNLRGLAEELGIALVPRTPVTGATDGDQYGNLEALPDGRWYVGDEISDTLRNTLAAQGPLTAVPTRWLEVGHVDEVYSLLPDRTLVQADPLRALVLLALAPASEWQVSLESIRQRFSSTLSTRRVGPVAYFKLVQEGQGPRLLESLRYFRREGGQPSLTDTVADYDLSLPIRRVERTSETGQVISEQNPADVVVHSNLSAQARFIEPGAQVLASAAGSPRIVRVAEPYLYLPPPKNPQEVPRSDADYREYEPEAPDALVDTFMAAGPSPVNLVVLDGTVLTADPIATVLREDFRRQLQLLGVPVRFLPALEVWASQGGLHCVTQVQRTPATRSERLRIRYVWESLDGVNLDTRTGMSAPVAGAVVGAERAASAPYVQWQGDATGAGGEEVVQVDLGAIRRERPNTTDVRLGLAAFWYGASQRRVARVVVEDDGGRVIELTGQLVSDAYGDIFGTGAYENGERFGTLVYRMADGVMTFNAVQAGRVCGKADAHLVRVRVNHYYRQTNSAGGEEERGPLLSAKRDTTLLVSPGSSVEVRRELVSTTSSPRNFVSTSCEGNPWVYDERFDQPRLRYTAIVRDATGAITRSVLVSEQTDHLQYITSTDYAWNGNECVGPITVTYENLYWSDGYVLASGASDPPPQRGDATGVRGEEAPVSKSQAPLP